MSNIEIDLVKTLAIASEDAYLNTSEGALILTPGYGIKTQLFDYESGFSVLVLKKHDVHEFIFAFRGTEGTSAQDWYTNLTLGTAQWNANADKVAGLIGEIERADPNAKIHFTGHSLGGALAQYAAYTYEDAKGPLDFDLVTFNALGAELGLKRSMIGDITHDPAKATEINAAHYAIATDVVSRLGDNHIGGELFIIQKETDYPLAAHPIAQFTGFVDGYTAVTDTQYALATAESNYLSIEQPLLASGIITSIGDDGVYSNTEATLRTISALGFGLAQASATDVGDLVAAMFGDEQKLGSTNYGALEFVAGVALGRFQASKQASLASLGIGAYALTVANVLQASTEFWAEHPGIEDVMGMPLSEFISDVVKPALGIAEVSLESSLQHEISAEEHQEALQDFERTKEWVTAFDPTSSGNQIYVQGSELDDLLVDYGSVAWWESEGTQLYGYSGNDTLEGGSGDDWLVGAEGDDLLRGGAGEDIYLYTPGDGHDVIDDADRSGAILIEKKINEGQYFSLAGHQRHSSANTWRDDATMIWNGDGGDLEISGADLGPDGSITIRNFHNGDYGIYLTGATASGHAKQFGDSYVENTLVGSAGPDKLYGHSLNDVLHGGAGDDELYGADGDDQLNGGEGHDQIFGSYGDDVLDGGPGSDQLFSGDGNNILHGGDGNDEIFALDGADSIYGGAGADEIYSSGGNDIVYGGPGSDLVFASFGSDRIYGGEGSDILHGGPGNDYLEGGGGPDIYTYETGDGYDTIVDSGPNTLQFGAGILPAQLTIHEGQNSLFINTGADSDTLEIRGYSAADPRSSSITRFIFHDGSTRSIEDLNLEANSAEPIQLSGGESDDYLRGSWLPDKIIAGSGDDTLEGSGGPDLLYGNAGNDLLEGGAGDDKLYGGKDSDTLRAGDGNDRLKGGSGDDTLAGGVGNDVLIGGAGNDTYLFALGDGRDNIKNNDANPGSHDLLQIQSIAHDELWLSRHKDHLIVDVVGSDDRIKVKNWYASPDNQVDAIQAGEHTLLAAQVDQLVSAMAVFDVPSGAGAVIPEQTRTELEVTLASSWQATA